MIEFHGPVSIVGLNVNQVESVKSLFELSFPDRKFTDYPYYFIIGFGSQAEEVRVSQLLQEVMIEQPDEFLLLAKKFPYNGGDGWLSYVGRDLEQLMLLKLTVG